MLRETLQLANGTCLVFDPPLEHGGIHHGSMIWLRIA
jgi:hypothetical protein